VSNEVSFCDCKVEVSLPVCERGEWWVYVRARKSVRTGPFESFDAAQLYRKHRFMYWRAVSVGRGGWLWKKAEDVWVATVPKAPGPGGILLHAAPCSRADYGVLDHT